MTPQTGALSNIRICDFTGQLAGAGATRVFAAFGAQVIRIEDPLTRGSWDILRGIAPYADERRGIELGGAFNNHNVEKLGITLNLRKPEAKEIVRHLIAISDVVSENFSVGVLERWGLSYGEMAAIKPDIIYVSNCGFGHEGPYSHFKTWGPIVQAVSGLTFQSGLPDMPPAGWGFSHMDHTGGYFMAIAILMALYHRNRTGVGQWVDMSCTDAGASLNGPAMLDYTVNGRGMRRPGSPHSNRSVYPPMAPHGIYRCEGDDRWVAIAVRDDRDWNAMREAMGRPEWAEDARFETLEARLEHEDALDALVEVWTSVRGPMQVMDALQRKGVPAAAVQRPYERIDHDPNTADWGLFPEVEHPEMGRVRVDGMPIRLSETPARFRRGAPTLGQHNRFVLGEILEFTDEKIRAMESEGMI